ncbi:MAG: hypothetical protein P8Y28_05490 [Gammaproteobacteria bacterium]|jgi:hypothetical protein
MPEKPMTYKIELYNQPDYIYVAYTKQANLDARKSLTNDLIQVCKDSEIFDIIIDTTNMNHAMSPIDFFAFADAFCSSVSDRNIKVVIVSKKLEKFTVLTKIVMNSSGIVNALFDSKKHAVEWLFGDSKN